MPDNSADNCGQMEAIDQDEVEDTFVLERNSGEPNADGTFASAASVDDMPEDLKAQLKAVLKALRNQHGTLIPTKRRRNDVLKSAVVGALRSVASRYSTTADEDEELLKHADLDRRHRMAVVVRLGEKRLIQEACARFSEDAAQDAQDAHKRTKRG